MFECKVRCLADALKTNQVTPRSVFLLLSTFLSGSQQIEDHFFHLLWDPFWSRESVASRDNGRHRERRSFHHWWSAWDEKKFLSDRPTDKLFSYRLDPNETEECRILDAGRRASRIRRFILSYLPCVERVMRFCRISSAGRNLHNSAFSRVSRRNDDDHPWWNSFFSSPP